MTSRCLTPLSIAVVLASGCTESIVGNGHAIQDTRTLVGFTQVANNGSLDVRVTQAPVFLVVVNADSNLLPLIATTVEGGVLTVATTKPFRPTDPIRVDISLPALAGAANSGSGSFLVSAAQTQDLALSNRGSGSLSFIGQAGAVSVALAGSGTTTLSGSGAKLDGSNSGSGSLDASGFPVGEATLACAGSGKALLTVHGASTLALNGSGSIQATLNGGTANFAINGSGNIDWTGTSAVGNSAIRGSGSINHH